MGLTAPADSMFLAGESREHPTHAGGRQRSGHAILFTRPIAAVCAG